MVECTTLTSYRGKRTPNTLSDIFPSFLSGRTFNYSRPYDERFYKVLIFLYDSPGEIDSHGNKCLYTSKVEQRNYYLFGNHDEHATDLFLDIVWAVRAIISAFVTLEQFYRGSLTGSSEVDLGLLVQTYKL